MELGYLLSNDRKRPVWNVEELEHRLFALCTDGKICTRWNERESLGGKAEHADQEVQAEQIVTMLRQIEVSIANGKTTPSLQRSRDHHPDVLPLEEGIRRFEDGPGKADEGIGERERQAEAAVADLSLDNRS